MELRESPDPATPFLDTVEGEMSFFRSIMRARPIGLHRHFHVLSMRTAIHQDTGRYVGIDDIWEKLRSCYNVDALESLVRDSAFCENAYLFQLITGRRGVRVARVRALHTKRRRLALPLRQPLSAPLFPQGVRPSIRRSTGLHHLQPSRPRHGLLDLFFPFAPAAAHQRAAREAARARGGRAGPEPRACGKRQQRTHARERGRERRRADAERKREHHRHGRRHRIRRGRGRRGRSLSRYVAPRAFCFAFC
jgi:hypothetical protein